MVEGQDKNGQALKPEPFLLNLLTFKGLDICLPFLIKELSRILFCIDFDEGVGG